MTESSLSRQLRKVDLPFPLSIVEHKRISTRQMFCEDVYSRDMGGHKSCYVLSPIVELLVVLDLSSTSLINPLVLVMIIEDTGSQWTRLLPFSLSRKESVNSTPDLFEVSRTQSRPLYHLWDIQTEHEKKEPTFHSGDFITYKIGDPPRNRNSVGYQYIVSKRKI